MPPSPNHSLPICTAGKKMGSAVDAMMVSTVMGASSVRRCGRATASMSRP
jgi:hypothetical protein